MGTAPTLDDGTVTVYGSASAIEPDWFGATDSLWRASSLGTVSLSGAGEANGESLGLVLASNRV